MTSYNTSDLRHAANTIDQCVHDLRPLIGHGYGNNIEVLITLLDPNTSEGMRIDKLISLLESQDNEEHRDLVVELATCLDEILRWTNHPSTPWAMRSRNALEKARQAGFAPGRPTDMNPKSPRTLQDAIKWLINLIGLGTRSASKSS